MFNGKYGELCVGPEGQRSIIDSVRTVAEAEAIRAAGGMLLAVEARSANCLFS